MFPLQSVLFPRAALGLRVFEPRYRALVADCGGEGGTFGVVLIARGSEVGGGDERVGLGTLARIGRVTPLTGDRLRVEATGTRRIRVKTWLPDDPYPRALVEEVHEGAAPTEAETGAARSAVVRLRSLLSELRDVPPLPHDLDLGDDPTEVGWRLCSLAPLGPLDRQELLGAPDARERMTSLATRCDAMARDVAALLAGEGRGRD